MEDVIIIGAGPAGISAALYTARSNLNPIVINNGIGALAKAEKIENYYGLEEPISGEELYERGLVQAKALGVRIIEAQVLGIKGFDTFTVQTTAGDFDTVSVILATGSRRLHHRFPEYVSLREKVSAIAQSVMRSFTETVKWQFSETVILPFMKQKNFEM